MSDKMLVDRVDDLEVYVANLIQLAELTAKQIIVLNERTDPRGLPKTALTQKGKSLHKD